MNFILSFLALCFFPITIMAEQNSDQLGVESQLCEFDGKTLTLSGSVTLEHELGTITAEEAILYSDPNIKKISLGVMEIKKNVSLKSKDGGELTCGEAKLNYKTMQGHFNSGDTAGFVIFCDDGSQKEKPSLTVRSRTMDALIERKGGADKSHFSRLSEITALNDVQVEFNSKKGSSNTLMVFSGEKLFWDLSRDLFKLSHNVLANISGSGTLKTEEELDIYYHNVKGKRELRAIVSHGYTVLTSADETQTGQYRILQSFGGATLDNEKLETTFNSPLDEQGKVSEDWQVVFRDSMGELHADKLMIFYQSINGKLIPINMIAEGNVYLLDRKGTPVDVESTVLHYALADRVDYNFEREEAFFYSEKKKRVLFFDKVNNMQMSAPALKLKRNGTAKKPSIQGMGDVRFSFMESEAERIKSRFESLPHRY